VKDVDGLYTADPKTNPDAEFIAEIGAEELIARQLPTLPVEPVVLELLVRAKLAKSIRIVNGLIPGNLTRALNGELIGPRSPVAGRGQAARNQIFRTTTGAEAYVRRNKAAVRLVRRAPDQPSRNLPPPPFLFRHRRARRGAWHGADDLR
jgi:hypothetical protein